jgi:hypothetical protein
MALVQMLPSFNSGELSPFLDALTSLEKYRAGCRTLENFILLPYGGAVRRPGTQYLGAAKNADKRCRLIGFNFSTTTNFVLEVGEEYIRFWSNGAIVESSPSTPLEVATPYQESELREIQYIQINDIVYLVHPSYAVRKLSRVSDTSWTIAEVDWTWPAFLDENTEDTTITPSGTTGSITLTASDDVFESTHVGAFFRIAHRRDTAYVERVLASSDGNSSNLTVLGDWELTTYGSWDGRLKVERSYDGGTAWETIRTYESASAGERNVSTTGNEEKQCLLRLNWDGDAAGSSNPNARLEASDNRIYGVVQITAYASATSATATVINDLQATTATTLWAEGAFSDKQGHPRTVALHEQRLIFGGTSSKPLTVWGSVVDDFENFRFNANDDGAFAFTLSSNESNPINWIVSQTSLLIGTAGNEWTLGASDTSQVLSPTNVQAKFQSSFGSKYLQARLVNEVIIFTQRNGRKARELTYSFEKDGWVAPDLTILAEHITKGELLETAFQQQPDAIYWGITGAGVLIGMTYERDQNVVGWHRHSTQGEFESVATIYGDGGSDELWMSVKRTVDGSTARYIERLYPDYRAALDDEDKNSWWYLDSALNVIFTPSAGTAVTGMDHLEGLTVDILGDGAVYPSSTVAAGALTLPSETLSAIIGLPFTSTLRPMKLDAQLQTGTAQGRKARIHEIVARFYKSLGGEFSTDGTVWNQIPSRDIADDMDSSPPAFTGDRKLVTGANYADSADLWIRQTEPIPLVLLALIPKWNSFGE